MSHKNQTLQWVLLVSVWVISVAFLGGCGFERLEPPLPDVVAGFSLADLEDIQDDERLTDDEKRDAIREAIDAPDTEEGDRLVEFLLDFNVP
jgi:hypothetical protein